MKTADAHPSIPLFPANFAAILLMLAALLRAPAASVRPGTTNAFVGTSDVLPLPHPRPSASPTNLSWLRHQSSNSLRSSVLAAPQPATRRFETVLSRDANHNVCAVSTWRTNSEGKGILTTNIFRRIATGMNYRSRDGRGEWLPSSETLEILPDGSAALGLKGQHTVSLPADISSGLIELTGPDGTAMKSQPSAIALTDGDSSVIIARVKQSFGELLPTKNQVIWRDAFDAISADIIATYRKGSFECDVVLRSALSPSLTPEALGLSEETTRLQIVSEFVDTVQPAKREAAGRFGGSDLTLRFGSTLTMRQGSAFPLVGDAKPEPTRNLSVTNTRPKSPGIPVRKSWQNTPDGRTILIEEINYSSMKSALSKLSTADARPSGKTGSAKPIRYAFRIPLPSRSTRENATNRMTLALNRLDTIPGFAIDYWIVLDNSEDYTLESDLTYLVEGPVYLSGTTTIEGGCCIKFLPTDDAQGSGLTSAGYPSLDASICISGPIVCNTKPYWPAIFTSIYDWTAGVSFDPVDPEFDPSAWSYGCGLYITGDGTDVVLHDLKFSFMQCGVWFDSYSSFQTGSLNISDISAVDNLMLAYCGGANVHLRNCLLGSMPCGVWVADTFTSLEHVTVDRVSTLCVPGDGGGSSILVTNSVLVSSGGPSVDVITDGSNNGFYLTPGFGGNQFTAPRLPFQAAGAGMYYLRQNSNFRAQGTQNVDPALLDSLKSKTTSPPLEIPYQTEIRGELVLYPQTPCYVSGPPDLGYHYPKVDFVISEIFVNGGTISAKPGAVIASDGLEWGAGTFLLDQSAGFCAEGSPNHPVTFTTVQLVQEGLSYQGAVCFVPRARIASPTAPSLRLRFCDFYLTQPDLALWGGWADENSDLFGYCFGWVSAIHFQMRDCNLRGGRINLGNPYYAGCLPYPNGSVSLFNNVFDRVNLYLEPTAWGTEYACADGPEFDIPLSANNNLFHGGRVELLAPPNSGGNWSFKNNLFDATVFIDWPHDLGTGGLDHDYNAYRLCSASELTFWQQFSWHQITDRWSPDDNGGTAGANDVFLPSSPAYDIGPLGEFYPPPAGSAAGIINAGSRSPADAGLFHFTTRLDQTKDASQAHVNIGHHYVATANAASNVPKDFDDDGIPDFVENATGDGTYHAGTETDWQNNYTDGPNPDSLNALYDDVDLDGDGMVGRFEKALGTEPLESHTPLQLTQVVTGSEPDTATFKLDMDYDSNIGIALPFLWVDGRSGSQFQNVAEDPSDGKTLLKWQATYDTPGLHLLQPHLYLRQIDYSSGAVRSTEAIGTLLREVTESTAQFDAFYADFDDAGATIYTKLSQDTDFTITLQDPAAPSGPPIRTMMGTTAASEIKFDWNLLDDRTGSPFPGARVNVLLALGPSGAPTETHSQSLRRVLRAFGEGDMTTAFSWALSAPGGPYRTCIQKGVVDPLIGPDLSGSPNPNPYPHLFNDFSTASTPGIPGLISTSSDYDALLTNLGDATAGQSGNYTRNFYWSGHGTENTFGGQFGPLFDAVETGDIIGNTTLLGSPRARGHPYRFVFLDACWTGRVPLWAAAFGITESVTYQQLLDRPERVQAFLGWNRRIAMASNATEASAKQTTLTFFFGLWQRGWSLETCVEACSRFGHPPAFLDPTGLINITFPLGAVRFSDQLPVLVQSPESKAIYGYPKITRTGFNPP